MAVLDETISVGQIGHVNDSMEIAKRLNGHAPLPMLEIGNGVDDADAIAAGAVIDFKPTNVDGYNQIHFWPEQGDVWDVGFVVHKWLNGTSQTIEHQHLSLYTSPGPDEDPISRFTVDYGTQAGQDALIEFHRSHIDFDTANDPDNGGGYVNRLVLKNQAYVISWLADNSNIVNLIGLNGGNDLEVGSTAGIDSIKFFVENASPILTLINGAATLGGNLNLQGYADIAQGVYLQGAGNKFIEILEHGSDFAAPGTDRCRIYVRETGGKTELVARFATGAVQQLAIQP